MGWNSREDLPGPDYRVRVEFDAPVDFVFRWCTDYSPTDASLEKETYERRVLERGPGRVVYEDLEDTPSGWLWSRDVVLLKRPTRWHMDGVGNRRDIAADYLLTALGPSRTRLELTFRRKPKVSGLPKVSKAARERMVSTGWRHFRTALEKDYRAKRR